MPTPLYAATDAARFGGKAAGLAACLNQGFVVPEGHALEVDLVRAVVSGGAKARQACAPPEATARTRLEAEVAQLLQLTYHQLRGYLKKYELLSKDAE